MTPLQQLRLFIASPGDVTRERDHVVTTVAELNRSVAPESGFQLEVVRWETHARPDMGRVQQIINEQIGEVDLFIGIMWHRFGTPTGVASSGSEEEFDRAYASWESIGHPRILYYFSEAPIKPPAHVEDAQQLLDVVKFRERVQKSGLAFTYSTDAGFKDLLRDHLQQILLKEFKGRRPPLQKGLLANLNAEKVRCREHGIGFFTSNLLLALLASDRAVRQYFEAAWHGSVDSLAETLKEFIPHSKRGTPIPFKDFDWYERKDVQAARHQAAKESAPFIDARMLLHAILTENSGTLTALRDKLGDEVLEKLREQTATSDLGHTPIIHLGQKG